ncbi:hypothetical protein D779_0008 [Imhoffiella purpurea]|uniref:Uncharacterized protein n=1 Tax=Imhoffiella purpurea TaxID=1249627 RepID=W9VJJ8_9GAMM|nr:hypothetical protein D779_0008 [Imhoffiella purpurea]
MNAESDPVERILTATFVSIRAARVMRRPRFAEVAGCRGNLIMSGGTRHVPP